MSASGAALDVLNPATEEVLVHQPLAGAEEVDRAVAAARAAAPAWRAVAPADRARLLRRLAAVIDDHRDELAGLETANVGKPISSSRGEVGAAVDVFHYYAGSVDKHVGDTIPVAGGVAMTFHEPLGVVGLITPWNFPLLIASWKLGPALACGNTVVLKPSELTPLTTVRLGELALEAGLPEGVLEVVVGTGAEAGWRLVEHPDVAKIGFTGSTAVGKRIMAGCAEQVKRVTLELGGKSANIVFADADLEAAAAAAPYAVFDNTGQDCCARSRVLVERSVFDRFVSLLVDAAAGVVVGDPLAEATEVGPLVSSAHRAKVEGFVDGVDTAFQGSVPDGPGFWFPCTVVAPADPASAVFREEVFGPVVAVVPFDDEADAIAIANDSQYGLSGSIWSGDGSRALRVARALEAGTLSINSNSSVRVATPFGGFKGSGLGRELSMQALSAYSELKTVYFSTS